MTTMMAEYTASFLLCAVLLLQGGTRVSSVAPGDKQSQCLDTSTSTSLGQALVNAYTESQKPLFDSYWYFSLFGRRGAVWESIGASSGRNGWVRGLSALCRSTIQARCTEGAAEDNWLSSQYISRDTVQSPSYDLPIHINIRYRFGFCDCPRRYGVYVYPTTSQAIDNSQTANYVKIGEVSDSTSEATASFSFILESQYRGFYLAFRDQDSCGRILRVMVYRNICPQRTEGLAIYPETPAGTTSVSVSHKCAANAAVTGGGLMCAPNGTWSGSPSCGCNAGHQLVGSECQACPSGTYQSNNTCVTCPVNTATDAVGASSCTCLTNYYRAPSDPSSDPCTEPPTRVQQLQVTASSNTSITIRWNTPVNTGGRSDLSYRISYRRIGTEQATTVTTTANMYTITGLLPLSEYRITVVSTNGITEGIPDAAAITQQSRTTVITANTTEGVPGPPAQVVVVGCTVIWKPPQTPNGNLIGYIIRIYPEGSVGQAQSVNKSADDFYHALTDSNLPAGDNLRVQVRGKTRIGAGEWSTAQPLSRDACAGNAAPPPATGTCPPPPRLPGCIWCDLCSSVCGYGRT